MTSHSRVKEDWICCSSSCFVCPDSQKQLWCVLISVTVGPVGRPAEHWHFPAGSHCHYHVCSVRACLFDGKWGGDPAEPTETEQTSGKLSLTDHCCMYCTHAVHTGSAICPLRFIYICDTHTQKLILKSFSTNFRESLDLMMLITVCCSAHNGESKEWQDRVLWQVSVTDACGATVQQGQELDGSKLRPIKL